MSEAQLPPRWREENGVVSFSVTSDGTTGEGWIQRLEAKGLRVSPYAKSVLLSKEFRPTTGITTEVRVLKGDFFGATGPFTKNFRAEAGRRKWVNPNAEVGCLVRDMFSDVEIGVMGLLWIVVMHDPIEGSGGRSALLTVSPRDGGCWLSACDGDSMARWYPEVGLAFALVPAPLQVP